MELDERCDVITPQAQSKCASVLNDLHNIDVLDMQRIGIKYEDVNDAITEVETMKTRIKKLETPKTCLSCSHFTSSTFFGDMQPTLYCHENKFSCADINFNSFYCNRYEQKDNA